MSKKLKITKEEAKYLCTLLNVSNMDMVTNALREATMEEKFIDYNSTVLWNKVIDLFPSVKKNCIDTTLVRIINEKEWK